MVDKIVLVSVLFTTMELTIFVLRKKGYQINNIGSILGFFAVASVYLFLF